jgi:cytochrome c553
MGKSDMLNELREYAASTKTDDIMAAHVQGYTDAQLQAIATYLANL